MPRSSLEAVPTAPQTAPAANKRFSTLPLKKMLPRNATQEIQILLVEDDDIDAMAFDRHLRNANFKHEIHRAIDGGAALEMLRASGDSAIPTPHMIVLDLNMPRMTGLEFLVELRADDRLCRSVVFVFTTSDAAKDRTHCFDHNVAAYLLKSRAGQRFEKLVALLESYVEIAEFPPDPRDEFSE